MSYEFGVILTDAPNICGGFHELPKTETDDFAGTHIEWDHGVIGYSGWNHWTAHTIADQTGNANYALLTDLGNQSYVKLSERVEEIEEFAARLEDITDAKLRAKCSALVDGCREALRLDPDRAVLLVY